MNNPIHHPKLAELMDFVEQRVTPSAGTLLQHHLDSCGFCAGKLRDVKELVQLMRTDDTQDAPRDLVAFAVNLFKSRQHEKSIVRRLIAILSFDSLTTTPAFGVRSANISSRQLLYSAEDSEIDLRVSQQDNSWIVSGQVLGHACVQGQAEIIGDDVSLTAGLNDLCEFRFPGVPAGEYTLNLRFPDIVLEVPRLELRT